MAQLTKRFGETDEQFAARQAAEDEREARSKPYETAEAAGYDKDFELEEYMQRQKDLGRAAPLYTEAEQAGLEGPQVKQYAGLGLEGSDLRSRARRSQAAQDILQQQARLASAQMGIAASARGPFAGAALQAGQRAVGSSGAQASALAGAADLSRAQQVEEMMNQLRTTGEIQAYREDLASEAQKQAMRDMFKQGGTQGSLTLLMKALTGGMS
jgi:hypothetical protein